MFASTLLQPVTRQYIYDQLLSQYRLQNARNTSESRQNRSCSGRENIEHDKLFEEVFDWFIYLELTLAMSALLTTPLLGSWSDRIGRKVAFLVPSFFRPQSMPLFSTSSLDFGCCLLAISSAVSPDIQRPSTQHVWRTVCLRYYQQKSEDFQNGGYEHSLWF